MKNQFAPYQESIELKELGFNEPCIAKYINKQFSMNVAGEWYKHNSNEITNGWVSAPLWQQVFEWFRVTYNLEGQVKSWKEKGGIIYHYSVQKIGEPSIFRSIDCATPTYEEAQLKCLQKLIQIIKNEI